MGKDKNRVKMGAARRARSTARTMLGKAAEPFLCCLGFPRAKMLSKEGSRIAARFARRPSKASYAFAIPQKGAVGTQATAEVGTLAVKGGAPLLLTSSAYQMALETVIETPEVLMATSAIKAHPLRLDFILQALPAPSHRPLSLTFPGFGYEQLSLPASIKNITFDMTKPILCGARACAAASPSTPAPGPAAAAAQQPLLLAYPGCRGYVETLPDIKAAICVDSKPIVHPGARTSAAAPVATVVVKSQQMPLLLTDYAHWEQQTTLPINEFLAICSEAENPLRGMGLSAAAPGVFIKVQQALSLTSGDGLKKTAVPSLKGTALAPGIIFCGVSARCTAATAAAVDRVAPLTKTVVTATTVAVPCKAAPTARLSPRELEFLRAVTAPPEWPLVTAWAEEQALMAQIKEKRKIKRAAAAAKRAAEEQAAAQQAWVENWVISAAKAAAAENIDMIKGAHVAADVSSNVEIAAPAGLECQAPAASGVSEPAATAAGEGSIEQEGAQGVPAAAPALRPTPFRFAYHSIDPLPHSLYMFGSLSTADLDAWNRVGPFCRVDRTFYSNRTFHKKLQPAFDAAEDSCAKISVELMGVDLLVDWNRQYARDAFKDLADAYEKLAWFKEFIECAAMGDAAKSARLGLPRRAVPVPEWLVKGAQGAMLVARQAIAAGVDNMHRNKSFLHKEDRLRLGDILRTTFRAMQVVNAALPWDCSITPEYAMALTEADSWVQNVLRTPGKELVVPYFMTVRGPVMVGGVDMRYPAFYGVKLPTAGPRSASSGSSGRETPRSDEGSVLPGDGPAGGGSTGGPCDDSRGAEASEGHHFKKRGKRGSGKNKRAADKIAKEVRKKLAEAEEQQRQEQQAAEQQRRQEQQAAQQQQWQEQQAAMQSWAQQQQAAYEAQVWNGLVACYGPEAAVEMYQQHMYAQQYGQYC